MYALKAPTHNYICLEERLNLNRKHTRDVLSQISCHASKLPALPCHVCCYTIVLGMPSQARPSGHAKFIQTTKKLLAAQSQSAAVVRAGSFVAVDDQTNCRLWSNLRGFTAKTCRDIGPFSFQRWAKIYYAEFVICLCETPFRCPFVDIDFAILVSMEHSVTRGKQRLLIFFLILVSLMH